MSYFEILPRVLANQIFILLPAMLFMQWTGLAFVGSPHVSLPVFIGSVAFITLVMTLYNTLRIALFFIGRR